MRKAFLANVSDVYKLADEYAETHGFTVTVRETTARGYYLSIPVKSMISDLPPNIIQPVKTGRFINCTTEEVGSHNDQGINPNKEVKICVATINKSHLFIVSSSGS